MSYQNYQGGAGFPAPAHQSNGFLAPQQQGGGFPAPTQQGGFAAPTTGAAQESGTIHKVRADKGFGFIHRPNGEQIFMHASQMRNCDDIGKLQEGDRVSYQVGSGRNPGKTEAQEVYIKEDLSHRNSFGMQSFGRGRGRGGFGRGRGRGRGRGMGRGRGRGMAPRGRGMGYGAQQYGAHTERYDPYAAPYNGGHQQQYGPPSQQHGAPESYPAAGVVKRVNEKGFGFVIIDGDDVFFHSREVANGKFDELKPETEVVCMVGPDPRNPGKWQAKQVQEARGSGTIDGLKKFFGFINSSEGERLFFHGRHVVDNGFEGLTEGAQVEYRLAPNRGKDNFEAQEVKMVQ
jgi:cold shock CspA family protein